MAAIDRYEIAVYSEEAADLATELLEVIARRTIQIGDPRVRASIIASALGTTAQMADGGVIFRPGGVTHRLRAVTTDWKVP